MEKERELEREESQSSIAMLVRQKNKLEQQLQQQQQCIEQLKKENHALRHPTKYACGVCVCACALCLAGNHYIRLKLLLRLLQFLLCVCASFLRPAVLYSQPIQNKNDKFCIHNTAAARPGNKESREERG